jgi:bifunctional DNase/RNase
MTATDLIMINQVYLKSGPDGERMVILKEEAESERYFMMFVGEPEFAAIAKEKGLIEARRPLTHELYIHIVDKLQVDFKRVEIYELKQDTFYANVVFQASGSEFAVDSRPSDAVALALNQKIPILVNQNLLRRELTEDEIKEYEGIIKTVEF